MMTRLKTIAATSALVAAMTLGAQGAQALTLAFGETTCEVSQFTIAGNDSSACAGAFVGNDSNQDLSGLFGGDWTELVKVEIKGSQEQVTQNGTTLTLTAGNGFTWKITDWMGYNPVMAVVKAGNYFSAYLVDTSLGKDGEGNTFSILVGKKENHPAISHLAIYYDKPGVVPLPAAGWLLLMGIGGLGVAARRRRKGLNA